ncbi:nucleoside hydrolase [Leptotrichia sp. oral taxon 212]|jgi:purine nucleosidase|uniref:nucleoside hydrolase n=1 Tax=Leptotrichia sp. oral taxon 212 TaxID=712357 RepID=UPI0006A944AF|nr:nucleoside hydrolase [Leptotrichia sp. oral taxon 212]ALA95714.1 ribonucleoside hydrolase [Leptotrichia sp. oral taxon 212]
MQKEKIILDCDPGHDDAVAIMLAAINPKIELLGITVVAGNQKLEKTVNNALKVCNHLNLDVPVYSGMSRPMIREQLIADDIHGETGLDGPKFEELKIKAEDKHAVNFIIDTLMNSDEKVTLVPTGPLTNIGMAIRFEPRIIEKINRIVLMGGSYQLGNMTPAAEFNILADPDAAHIVFSSGVKIVMMGLDLTRQASATKEVVEKIKSLNNKASKLFVDLMEFFAASQKNVYGWSAPPVHDPTTIAYIIDPECIEVKPMFCEIELWSERSYGRTLCDYFGILKKEPNVDVAVKLDFDKFWNLVYENLKLYDNHI